MPKIAPTTEIGENAATELAKEGPKAVEIKLTEERLKPTTHTDKQLLVFSRRKKTKKKAEPSTAHKQSQDSTHNLELIEVHPGNTSPTLAVADIPKFENIDLDLPIAVRKGVRSCTQHLIGKYVFYDNLSQGYKAFVTAIDNVKIPRDI